MGAGRRGARRAPAAALGAALGTVLAAGAVVGARAGAGYHPTPPGYAELPDPAECKEGCETITMSGLELLHYWQKRPEGGKRWFSGGPLHKFVWDFGISHEGYATAAEDDPGNTRAFKVADAIFKHLGALEDTVEAEHALKTGVPVAEVSRADKQKRLLEAYLKEPTLKYNGTVLALSVAEMPGETWRDVDAMKALHVNSYHLVTGLLRWPFMDWRRTPRLGKMTDLVRKQRETCKPDTLPIYYISLVRRKDRRRSVEAAMVNNTLPFSYVDAVDGRDGGVDMDTVHVNPHMKIDDPEDPKYFLVPGLLMRFLEVPNVYLTKYWGREVAKGEVGLALSLKLAFEKALGAGHGSVLIMEDDHVLLDTKSYPNGYCVFLEAVQELHESGIEYDYIQIESYNWFGDDASKIPEGMSAWFVPLSTAHNTHAVLWHERGMRKMLASGYFERCVMVIDEYLSYMTNPGRHTRADFHDCYGEDGKPPAPEKRMKGLRWRGMRFIRDNIEQQKSSIDGEF